MTLRETWRTYHHENPKVRIRDAARALGVSEAELVASTVGESAIRLRPEIPELLKSLPALGRVMCLTRNEQAVHERRGVWESVETHGDKIGLVVGPDIDLRLFLSDWRFAFAVDVETAHGTRRSLQFFDPRGTAIHKVYAEDQTDMAAFEALVQRFRHEDQTPEIAIDPTPPTIKAPRPDAEIDAEALRADWRALRDTHEFHGLLRRHDVDRRQALRLAGEDLAKAVDPMSLTRTLREAAATQLSIMVFVGNGHALQIHTGPVKRIQAMGPWINVLDPEFNLHVRQDQIAEAWVVVKPTTDGAVTALELYAADGTLVAQLFGARKPGKPELPEWRALVAHELARTE